MEHLSTPFFSMNSQLVVEEDLSSLKLSIDVVVEVCGAKAVIPQAISSLKPGGAYILVGLIHPDSHLNLTAETVMRKCLTVRGM